MTCWYKANSGPSVSARGLFFNLLILKYILNRCGNGRRDWAGIYFKVAPEIGRCTKKLRFAAPVESEANPLAGCRKRRALCCATDRSNRQGNAASLHGQRKVARPFVPGSQIDFYLFNAGFLQGDKGVLCPCTLETIHTYTVLLLVMPASTQARRIVSCERDKAACPGSSFASSIKRYHSIHTAPGIRPLRRQKYAIGRRTQSFPFVPIPHARMTTFGLCRAASMSSVVSRKSSKRGWSGRCLGEEMLASFRLTPAPA